MQEEGFLDFSALLHCGVYMLLRSGKVVYVGQSKSLCARIHTHYTKRRGERTLGSPPSGAHSS